MTDVPKFKIDHTTIQPGKNHKVRVEFLRNCQTENCWRGLFWSEFQFGRKIQQKAFRFLCWVFCSDARSTHYHHIVSRCLAVEEMITADWRNVNVSRNDLNPARAFSKAREKVRIKTECPAWTDLQVSRLSSGPQPARKPTFSCNPLSPLHNSMTFGTTFPGLFPRGVFWIFYVILRLPRWGGSRR